MIIAGDFNNAFIDDDCLSEFSEFVGQFYNKIEMSFDGNKLVETIHSKEQIS